jgi:integrase/recombinase XerD
VTILLQRMREELVRRTYSETTIRSYLHAVEGFRQHVQKRLDHLGPDDLRRYQVYLLEDRKLANGTVVIQISALRFFYIKVLKRRDMKEDLPYCSASRPACRHSETRHAAHAAPQLRDSSS